MDKRETPNSKLAKEIVSKLPELDKIQVYITDHAEQVRDRVHHILWTEGRSKDYTLVVHKNTVRVMPKKQSRERRLEELLRKAMLYIDDENMYDEIMRALEE